MELIGSILINNSYTNQVQGNLYRQYNYAYMCAILRDRNEPDVKHFHFYIIYD